MATPASAPEATSHQVARGARTDRMAHQMAPAPAAPNRAVLLTCGYRIRNGPAKSASTPAAQATRRERHSSQPTKAVNGTSAADSSTNGSWAARQLPSSGSKTAIEAAATIEVSGIQWPLLGTGRVGLAGS